MSGTSRIMQIYEPVFRYTRSHTNYNENLVDAIKSTFEPEFNKRHMLAEYETHYIAIMAATRHRCFYIIDHHKDRFIAAGGNPIWLSGLMYAPPKYQGLDELNVKIAHQPWLINKFFIRMVVVEGTPTEERWSLSELTEAALVLTQTHAICSFIHALGNIEPKNLNRAEMNLLKCDDEEYQLNKENSVIETGLDASESISQVEELLRRMRNLEANGGGSSQDTFDNALAEGAGVVGGSSPVRDPDELNAVFSNNPQFGYIDFYSKTEKNIRTFRIVEFNWKDHGFNVIEDCSTDKFLIATLDKKFAQTQSMTYCFMGKFEKVDTKKYRMAVWNYIQALFGIRHDDYEYSQVNVLLDKETKTFIKLMACNPHKLNANSLANVMTGFKQSEKIHVLILVAEARLQAQLLYYSRALCNYYVYRATEKPPLD